MRFVTAMLGFVLAWGVGAGQAAEEKRTWRQERGGSVWTLATTVTETTWGGHAAEIVRFSVRRDGMFLHQADTLDGGRLSGMKWFHGGPTCFEVEELLPEGGPGWLLRLAACTGSASSARTCVVIPRSDGTFGAWIVDSKDGLTQRASREGVELVGTYQEWGNGGTSTSVLVPFRLVVRPGAALARMPLPSDARACLPMDNRLSFEGVFVAGMRERNPDLMQSALVHLFVEPEQVDDDERPDLGLPQGRAALDNLVRAVRRWADARVSATHDLSNLGLDDPEGLVRLD
jgi:hypothetical protein